MAIGVIDVAFGRSVIVTSCTTDFFLIIRPKNLIQRPKSRKSEIVPKILLLISSPKKFKFKKYFFVSF